MTRNSPYVRHREIPRQRLDKAAQTQRDQRANRLRDKAKKLELPEPGLEGFIYSLGPGLLRVEKPASPEIVEAYVRLQSAAHELHNAIESVGRHDVHHRYLAANIDRVKKNVVSLLLPDRTRATDGEALFAVDAGTVRFSFNSKPGRPIAFELYSKNSAVVAVVDYRDLKIQTGIVCPFRRVCTPRVWAIRRKALVCALANPLSFAFLREFLVCCH